MVVQMLLQNRHMNIIILEKKERKSCVFPRGQHSHTQMIDLRRNLPVAANKQQKLKAELQANEPDRAVAQLRRALRNGVLNSYKILSVGLFFSAHVVSVIALKGRERRVKVYRSCVTEKPKQKMEVGFLGLGIMGKAMALNLLRSGFRVTVWNRTYSKCEELVKQGASIGNSPAEVVKKCKYTIAMLADPIVALSVAFGKDGVLEQICPGKGYIDMSTVDATTSRKINEAIIEKGGRFLEAPVSGSKKPAEDGQLIILAAGDKSLNDEIMPAFDVMGKKSFFLGEVGNAANMKLVVNMIMGSMMNAFSEGLVLADWSGLSQQTLLDVLELGAVANPMFKLKGPAMIQQKFPPAFPLKHQQKDMRLALALGDEAAVSMPVAAAANEAFKKARSLGLGDHDFSAVYQVVKETEAANKT